MTDINIVFCRRILSAVHVDVKGAFPKLNLRASAWVWSGDGDLWEFHGPEAFYWYGRADNAYDARYKGWCSFLCSRNVKGYVR